MAQYINKSALVAEIENIKSTEFNEGTPSDNYACMALDMVKEVIDTLEIKEVDIPNIDDLLEEDGIDPYSKDVKLFKECYYTALEKLKEKKGE